MLALRIDMSNTSVLVTGRSADPSEGYTRFEHAVDHRQNHDAGQTVHEKGTAEHGNLLLFQYNRYLLQITVQKK